MAKRWRIGLLGLVVSILAIGLTLRQVDLQLLGEALRTARYGYLVPTVVLLIVALVPRALRWRILLDGKLPLRRAFHIMNVAYLVNGIVPLRMGEVARAFLASRAGVPVFKSASTIIVERLLDLLAILVLIGVALAGVDSPLPDNYRAAASFFAPLVIGGFLLLIVLAGQRDLAQRLLKIGLSLIPPLRRFEAPFTHFLDHFLDGLRPLTSPRLLLLAVFWTAVGWGFSVLAGYIVMLTFFDHASIPATSLYIAGAALAIALPAIPGNFGTYEGSIMLAISAMGYGNLLDPAVVSFAVLVHLTNLLVHVLTGVWGLLHEGITLEQLSSGVQQMRAPASTENRQEAYVNEREQTPGA